jgi:hypothetical protein
MMSAQLMDARFVLLVLYTSTIATDISCYHSYGAGLPISSEALEHLQ